MPQPFMSEIRLFSFGFTPKAWAQCNGQTLAINQNQALFSILGTAYGGNGQTTFALPDLRARVPMHRGPGHGGVRGVRGGERAHTVTQTEMPTHVHMLNVTNANGSTPQPANAVLAAANNLYSTPSAGATTLHPGTVDSRGGSQPHENMQPYLVMNYCLAMQGEYPSQNSGVGGSFSSPYIGEVRMFAGTYAPAGWEFCNGQELPISENEALFQLIGTTYGGDGESSFALPNLQSRVALHQRTDADSWPMGQMGGVEEVTLTTQQIPIHTHPFVASTGLGNEVSPGGNLVAETSGGLRPYVEDAPISAMSPQSATTVGGSQPHSNMQQFVTINYIISLFGEFPSPT